MFPDIAASQQFQDEVLSFLALTPSVAFMVYTFASIGVATVAFAILR